MLILRHLIPQVIDKHKHTVYLTSLSTEHDIVSVTVMYLKILSIGILVTSCYYGDRLLNLNSSHVSKCK